MIIFLTVELILIESDQPIFSLNSSKFFSYVVNENVN